MNAQHQTAIGVDVGATTTRVGFVGADGCVISCRRDSTRHGGDAALAWITERVRDVIAESAARGVRIATCLGVALPGIVDRTTGVVARSVNLPALEGRRIADELERAIGLPVAVMTDAEAAAWGEYVASRRPGERFAHLRIGTGIACGIVLDGRLVATDPRRRTHWEMLIVDRSADAPACVCGLRGCLELFASGRVLDEKARAVGLLDGVMGLQAAFAAGRTEAGGIVRAAARAVCTAVGNISREFGVETFSIGGGVIEQLPCLLAEIRIALVSPESGRSGETVVTVEPSRLGDDAGVIGAALLASASAFSR